MTMMKKKSAEAMEILNKVIKNPLCERLGIRTLIHKYQGYGYFKLSQYGLSVKCYGKLTEEEQDPSSQYNRLLAEGVELADSKHHF